ncbi:cell wall hydrolase [Sphingomonas xinjiangensis]|uniref:Spore germination cell wall hydrolase CwlJ-like protein n=1 Tax=Sphingomonas xinjiangensis TaxID=643568 RepID=A0A840YCK8_9SPHN|nr:cell wall hydrolase [Sphingomonas xinjiangensis]MBB5711117.1 spore germination cell wall hydrolase CwlJ-like protein [Sphingomonas xinjiangensis]
MKFTPLAATIAAVTLCAGALANAATLDAISDAPAPVQSIQNDPEPQSVPTPQPAALVIQNSGEIVQPIPQDAVQEDEDFASLSEAVAAQDAQLDPSDELECLAVGIYYESKGEPLAGQFAVAQVLINRTQSGRFPKSVCSVLTQRGQFSFVRGGKIPTPPANAQWRQALAIAQVAQKDLWDGPAEDALYFHARYSKANWARPRVASIGNHIFYR